MSMFFENYWMFSILFIGCLFVGIILDKYMTYKRLRRYLKLLEIELLIKSYYDANKRLRLEYNSLSDKFREFGVGTIEYVICNDIPLDSFKNKLSPDQIRVISKLLYEAHFIRIEERKNLKIVRELSEEYVSYVKKLVNYEKLVNNNERLVNY